MKTLHDFTDIHRHSDAGNPGQAVVNLRPGHTPAPDGWYSAGIHPLEADLADTYLPWLEHMAQQPNVLAIGECGIDKLKGPDMAIQLPVFESQIKLSERVGKPLLIHNVKATDILMALRKKYKPKQEWIIHGYRGGPQLTQQLLSHGFSLSYGERYNAESYAMTPADRRYHETDAE